MSSAQLRLAETIDTFYGASDKASHNAIAANAYKRSVEELDAGVGRELVRGPQLPSITRLLITMIRVSLFLSFSSTGCPLSHNHPRSAQQDELVFPHNKRAHLKTEQKGECRAPSS